MHQKYLFDRQHPSDHKIPVKTELCLITDEEKQTFDFSTKVWVKNYNNFKLTINNIYALTYHH